MGNDNKIYNYVEANVMNIYATFQLHLPYGFWEERFLNMFFFPENLAFRLPWQPTIKISDLDKIHMVGRWLLKKHFCSNTEINANFHFSHYTSMETKLP